MRTWLRSGRLYSHKWANRHLDELLRLDRKNNRLWVYTVLATDFLCRSSWNSQAAWFTYAMESDSAFIRSLKPVRREDIPLYLNRKHVNHIEFNRVLKGEL